MTRFLIQVALPLFAPFAVYVAWLWWAQKRAERHGNEPPAFTKGTAFISILIGALLAILSLVVLALSGGESPGDRTYVSPRFEDGRIIEPHFEDTPPSDAAKGYRDR
ncbi:MAG: DUF6111 family protein [Rhodospirillales bacterium]